MPSEVRHLLFRRTEIVSAIQAHYRRMGRPLSSGLIAGCEVVGDGINGPITVNLIMHEDLGSSGPHRLQVDATTLIAALIMHCRDNRVPLPARAQKSLQCMSEQLCLVATLG